MLAVDFSSVLQMRKKTH